MKQRTQHGQAMVLVALTLGVLVTLAVLGSEVAYQRRSLSRVHNSVDVALLAGVRVVLPPSLAHNTPRLDAAAVEHLVRATLRQQLGRAAGALTVSPARLADQLQIRVLVPGERCQTHVATGPAVCAHLDFGLRTLLGERRFTYDTFAQTTDQLAP